MLPGAGRELLEPDRRRRTLAALAEQLLPRRVAEREFLVGRRRVAFCLSFSSRLSWFRRLVAALFLPWASRPQLARRRGPVSSADGQPDCRPSTAGRAKRCREEYRRSLLS